MSNQLDQTEIMKGLQAGDRHAWQTLFQEFAPKVWSFVASRMPGRARGDVEDVVQETMIAAARSARQFDLKLGSLMDWLKGIGGNQIAMYFRNENRLNVAVRAENEFLATSGKLSRWILGNDAPPEQWLTSQESQDHVHHILRLLPHEYQQLLSAKYFEGQTVEQMAQHRQVTATAIQSKLARARKAFREKFESTQVS